MNPLMQGMGGTTPMMGGNPIMGNIQSMIQQVRQIKQMLSGQNVDAVARMFAQKNPQFAQFQRNIAGKTPQHVAQEYGLDWNMVRQMIG